MAVVLPFKNKRKHSLLQTTVSNGPAEIVLFTGVRFERLEMPDDMLKNLDQLRDSDTSVRNRAS